ncbi:MAG: hypothetical protein K6L76_02495 [Agarilytica sp.]
MKKYSLLLLILVSLPAFSWDGSITGEIGRIQITAATNYGFRISLAGLPKPCGSNADWAYVSKDDTNYQSYLSALLAAKFAKSSVTLFSNKDTSDYCKIGHIYIN